MYASSSSLFLAHVTLVVNYTQEVQHVVLLLSELAKYQQTWRRTSPESILEFEEMSLHLLAYISREGLFRPGTFHGSHLGISCHPVLKEEITSHTRPAIVGCGLSWLRSVREVALQKRVTGMPFVLPKLPLSQRHL